MGIQLKLKPITVHRNRRNYLDLELDLALDLDLDLALSKYRILDFFYHRQSKKTGWRVNARNSNVKRENQTNLN